MVERTELLLYKLRFIFAGVVVITGLVLVSILLAVTVTAKGADTADSVPAAGMSDGPNAVANGMSMAAYDFQRTIDSTEQRLRYGLRTTGSIISRSGKTVGDGMQTGAAFAARGVGSGARLAGQGVKNSGLFVFHTVGSGIALAGVTAGTVFGFLVDTPVVSAVIKPAASTPVPVIDSRSPTLYAAKEAMPAVQTAAPPVPRPDTPGSWPLGGEITTNFGVPHWPYQPTHTGIDISDGQPSGTTAIKPFKPGKVVDTVSSYSGLGHHLVVDHGDGITSVYAHLASISVRPGQDVDKSTILGFEGTTGASTGTHLHFEIKVNGQPVNPLQYIGSQS